MMFNTALRYTYLLFFVLFILLYIVYIIPRYEWFSTLLQLKITHQANYKSETILKNYDEEPVTFYVCDPRTVSTFSPCLCYADYDPTGEVRLSLEGTRKISNVSSIRCAMTFTEGGRMGNFIGQYATLYTLSRLNRRPAFMTPGMAKILRKYFKVSIPSMSEELYSSIQWTNIGIHDRMDDIYTHLQGTYIKLNGYPFSYTFQRVYREKIRREFTLRDEIQDEAQEFLRNLASNRTSVTFVGVHVRRGDYIYLMQNSYHGVLADSHYFAEATQYFRSRYTDAIFVVVSNDMDWCKQNILNDRSDVYFVGNNNESDPIRDFSILMNCNHSIITVGTYSYFSAFLAGGEVVYLTNFTMPDSFWNTFFHFDSAFPPEWHPVAADLSPLYNTTAPDHNSSKQRRRRCNLRRL